MYEFERDEYGRNNKNGTSLSADTGQEALDKALLAKSIEVGGVSLLIYDLSHRPTKQSLQLPVSLR